MLDTAGVRLRRGKLRMKSSAYKEACSSTNHSSSTAYIEAAFSIARLCLNSWTWGPGNFTRGRIPITIESANWSVQHTPYIDL